LSLRVLRLDCCSVSEMVCIALTKYRRQRTTCLIENRSAQGASGQRSLPRRGHREQAFSPGDGKTWKPTGCKTSSECSGRHSIPRRLRLVWILIDATMSSAPTFILKEPSDMTRKTLTQPRSQDLLNPTPVWLVPPSFSAVGPPNASQD